MNLDYLKNIPKLLCQYGLYIFAFSIPISFVPAELGVVLSFIGWMLEGLINKKWQFYKTNLYVPIILYILWKIIASILSPRPMHSISGVLDNEWEMLIMLMMLFIITDIKVLRRMIYLWFTSSVVAAIYGIWQTFSGYQLHRPETLDPMGNYFRAVGFNGFYLTFAGFIMSVFFVSLCISVQEKLKNRWRFIFVSIVSFFAVIGTFARSIWISFAVVVPIFGFLKGKITGSIISGIFVISVILILIFIPSVRDRAISSIIPSENQTRLNLWKTSINIIEDNPILGVGEDNFNFYFDRYKVDGFYDTTAHPHNDYLSILVSSGIPGLIAFLIIWLIIIRYGFIAYRNSSNPFLKEISIGSTLAIIGFMIGGLFQNYYGTYANCWGWWFMAGITMSAYRLQSEFKKDQISL